jgi:arginase
MPLAKICGLGDLDVIGDLGLATVAPDRVLLVGARDLDPGEDGLLASAGVRRAAVEELRPELLPPGPLYLHLDVDVADPDELPGLLFPVPGGAAKADLEAAIATVAASGRVAAIGLGLTWEPRSTNPGRAAFLRDILRPLRA